MPRWLKITSKILLALVAMIAVAWLSAAYYIHRNNKAVLDKILTQINSKVNGTVSISHMETTLLKGFPGVSVSLKNTELRDSLFNTHRHPLLKAKNIDVTLNALSLILGTINIRKVAIKEANIYLYTDTNGYSNTQMFRKKAEKPKDSTANTTPLQIRLIDFENVDLVIDNQKRFKLFSFYIDEVSGKIKYPMGQWDGNFKVKTKVRSFAFNTRKGSFLKDKNLAGNMSAHYDGKAEVIVIDQKPIKIGDDIFDIGANINIGKNNPAFSIAIKADQIAYKNVANILSPNISEKLFKFSIEKPIDVTASIIDDGNKNAKDPLINVKMTVVKNNISIPSGKLTNCNFVGFFSNQDISTKPISDANSVIRFFNLKADYYNAPISIDTFTVANLEKPIASGLVTSKFELKKLNPSFEDDFYFGNGTAELKLFCKADIDNFLFTKPVVHGKVIVKNADITYLPRNLKLVDNSLEMDFNQRDLSITNSRFQLGKSIVTMSLSIENFLNFYYTDPQKMEINIKLNSPNLAIDQFIPFLGPRQQKKKSSTTKSTLKEASQQLGAALEAAKVNLTVNVDRAAYNKFVAHKVKANISLIGNGVHFNNISLNHAGGHINFNGEVTQVGEINKMRINTNINNVSIKEFFYAFDNFGQQSINHQNLKGFLSANVNATGNVTSKGNMVPRSIFGKVNFTLDKAALVGFEPIEKVGKFVFRSRNLSNVELEKLKGTLTLRGDKVDISPMKVNSTALNFDVQGVYGFNKGTNIALDIPLRDPKKSADIVDKEERELARMKGIVLHLKAVEENGELKIRWNKKEDREK